MKKFNRADELEYTLNLINAVLADYIKYFHDNNIELNDDKNPLVAMHDKLFDIETNKVYDCKDEDDFRKIQNIIKNGERMLSEA